MGNWFLQLFYRKRDKDSPREVRLLDEDSSQPLSTEKYLDKFGVGKEEIKVHVVDYEKIESTQEYLDKNNVGQIDLNVEQEIRRDEARHRITSRNIILWSLVVPMSIIPIWLMVLLTLPGLGKAKVSERMQLAYLAAVAGDFLGLYHVVTRYFFSSENSSRRNNDHAGDKDED